MGSTDWYADVVTPALLRHARTTYGRAMRRALGEAGYDDLPRNGLYVIGGMAIEDRDLPLGQLIQELGISKQAAGQLVDALVARGYLDRAVDPNDRRRLNITLTERGQAAAAVQAGARRLIDEALVARVGQEDVERMRRGLGALVDISREGPEVEAAF